jgi:hypothetical protein
VGGTSIFTVDLDGPKRFSLHFELSSLVGRKQHAFEKDPSVLFADAFGGAGDIRATGQRHHFRDRIRF